MTGNGSDLAASERAAPIPSAHAPSSVHKLSIPRLALSIGECCEALGVSHDFWQENVAPELRIVRRGRRKLVAVAELERWLHENGERTLERRGS